MPASPRIAISRSTRCSTPATMRSPKATPRPRTRAIEAARTLMDDVYAYRWRHELRVDLLEGRIALLRERPRRGACHRRAAHRLRDRSIRAALRAARRGASTPGPGGNRGARARGGRARRAELVAVRGCGRRSVVGHGGTRRVARVRGRVTSLRLRNATGWRRISTHPHAQRFSPTRERDSRAPGCAVAAA